VSRREVEGGFAYLDGGQVQIFSWKAEAEMPYFWRPEVSVNEDGYLITKDFIEDESISCVNQDCIRTPTDGKILGQDGKFYTLTRSEVTKRWEIRDEDERELVSFQAPENAYLEINIFPKVVVVEVFQNRNSYVTAYRTDGKRAEIANHFVYRILSDENMIVFGVYQEGLKVLDVEQWSVKRYEADDFNVLALVDDDVFLANQSWETGPSVQVVDISTKQSQHISVPDWRAGTWGASVESSAFQQTLLLIDSSGMVYVIDTEGGKFVCEFNAGYPYSNTAMTFSPDGRLFVTYGADGFIRVWAVTPEPLTAQTIP